LKEKIPSTIQWAKFAGLASQWAITLTVVIFSGNYIDQKIAKTNSVFIWILPCLFIVYSLFKIVRDTQIKSNKK
jgi:hypothetical protein